ncbi:hypothetical protein ACP70R_023605 [Stipagrostis hirtigluma subsp. patula]
MKKGILALSFLFLASQGSWCAADRSTWILAAADHPRRHPQVQELHETEGKKLLEIQSPRKLGHGQSLTHHEEGTVEMKHPRRMVIGHKGGGVGGGGGAGAGARSMGGGGSVTRPHSGKNGAAALPVPAASVLALAFASAVALSAINF